MANPVIEVESVPEEQIGAASAEVFEETKDVDIVSLTNKDDAASNKIEDPDATEYSSSFADTSSEPENGAGWSDPEVESVFRDENGMACPLDPYGPDCRTRKRKVTDHWRNFIRPLMCRLKWTELKLKQLKSQEFKYCRELEECDMEKHTKPDHFNLEESGSKSMPFSSHQYRSKAMMRRKRKKVENTTDLASYTEHHPLFSYLENKRSDADGSSDKDFDNPEPQADLTEELGNDEEQLLLDSDDDSYEQVFGDIVDLQCGIDTLHDRVDAVRPADASSFGEETNIPATNEGTDNNSS